MRGFITIAIVVFLVGAQASLITTFEEETENESDLMAESDLTEENDEVATEIVAEDTPSTFNMLQNVADIEDQLLQEFKDVEGCSNNTCTMCIGLLCFKLVYKNNGSLFEFVVGISTGPLTLIGIVPAAPFSCCELTSRFTTCLVAEGIQSNGSYVCADVIIAAYRTPYKFRGVCMKK